MFSCCYCIWFSLTTCCPLFIWRLPAAVLGGYWAAGAVLIRFNSTMLVVALLGRVLETWKQKFDLINWYVCRAADRVCVSALQILFVFCCNLQLVLSILWSYSNNLVRTVLMLTEGCNSTLGWSMLSIILLLLFSWALLKFIHCALVSSLQWIMRRSGFFWKFIN